MTALVPGVHLAVTGVGDGSHPGRTRVPDIEPPGSIGVTRCVGLYEDGVSVGQLKGSRIIESSNPLKRPQRVVEGPVLLHQNDDVFSVQIGRARLRLNGVCQLDRLWNKTGRTGSARQHGSKLEEVPSGLHDLPYLVNLLRRDQSFHSLRLSKPVSYKRGKPPVCELGSTRSIVVGADL